MSNSINTTWIIYSSWI